MSASGKKYWRSIDELANTPEFQAAVEHEFPSSPHTWGDEVSRRGFLKLVGASAALAGLAGCTRQPDEPIYPYIRQPENLILGKPNYFATAHPFPTGAVPLLVKTDKYRPIKIDGNPEHAYNRGASDVFSQGTLLDLYDPDRSQHVTYQRREPRVGGVRREAARESGRDQGRDGDVLPQRDDYLADAGAAVEGGPEGLAEGEAGAVGPGDCGNGAGKWTVNAQYDLSQADVIVSLDADFLSGASYPGFHKLVRDYAERRKHPEKGMNRLYVVESTPTTTGMKAEHRLGLRASEIPAFAAELAKAVGVAG